MTTTHPVPAATPAESTTASDPAAWAGYFDAVEQSMHEFEVALSRHEVLELRPIPAPAGRPPESFRRRSDELQRWITELEFRARFLREEIRAEIARIRPASNRVSEARMGSTLDING